ncbi:hypothetical protein GN958_ATG13223 [Phytophthora infestans]|nr:hypothetical protein GN958_ATG13223 [Phytophthora infestans]
MTNTERSNKKNANLRNCESIQPFQKKAMRVSRNGAFRRTRCCSCRKKHKGESRAIPCAAMSSMTVVEQIPEHVEYTPRNRTSKHVEELEGAAVSCDKVVNVVVPFPAAEISSWEEFNNVFSDYKRKNHLNFRVRSCETTVVYNSSHVEQMPTKFEWTHRVYRCTHGVAQELRSKGHRNRKSRYCGCKARFTPTVTETEAGVYRIIIRNEVLQLCVFAILIYCWS